MSAYKLLIAIAGGVTLSLTSACGASEETVNARNQEWLIASKAASNVEATGEWRIYQRTPPCSNSDPEGLIVLRIAQENDNSRAVMAARESLLDMEWRIEVEVDSNSDLIAEDPTHSVRAYVDDSESGVSELEISLTNPC